MKTITNIIATALLIINGFEASAQLSDHRFHRTCSEAYEALLSGQDRLALQKLEYLNRARPENDHVAYLLGMVGLRTGSLETQQVQRLLAQAALNYDPAHRHGDPTDSTAPRTVWLHLGESLALAGRNKEAIYAYRTYMTTIAMAPKEHKSEVIARITELRNGDRTGQLAMLK